MYAVGATAQRNSPYRNDSNIKSVESISNFLECWTIRPGTIQVVVAILHSAVPSIAAEIDLMKQSPSVCPLDHD
jgi:hypothetical protein